MPAKYMQGSAKLIAAMGLFCLSMPTMAAENRCGWIENPSPGTWWITDKDARWEISTQGGYSVPTQSIDNLPNVLPNEYVRVSGIYGYSCGCLSVDTDKRNRRVTKILQKGKQVFLKQCLEDKAIADRNFRGSQSTPTVRPPAPAPVRQAAPASSQRTAQVVQHMPVPTQIAAAAHYIQVITTSDRNKANSLKNSFAKDGFGTIVTSVVSNGTTLYRVNFGPFANRPSAIKAQAALKGIFAGNKNVQESILVSVKPNIKTTASKIPSTSTQCFSKKEGNDLTGIQLSINRDQVSGYFAWEPLQKDGGRGYLRGTLKGNQIIASHTYMVEGYVGTEEVAYRLVKGGLIEAKSEQVSNGSDSTRFKDIAAINWSNPSRFRTVDCRTIRGAINNAVSVQREIQKLKLP